jgi:hypothetical protein
MVSEPIQKTISNGASAVTQYRLGEGVGSRVSSLLVQFEFSAAADHTINIVGRVAGDRGVPVKSLLGVAYLNKTLGDVVSSSIEADSLVLIDCAGIEVFADVTTTTTGSVSFTSQQLVG